MSSILVNGSIAYDVLLGYEGNFTDGMRTESLDQLSLSFFCPTAIRHFGGTASNIAWHIAKLGGNARIVGALGIDGNDYSNRLKHAGVDTSLIQTDHNAVTATATIGTDTTGHQLAFFTPGADSTVDWAEIENPESISYALSGARDMTMMLQAVTWAKENNIAMLFDPGQQTVSLNKEDLIFAIEHSTGLICNQHEWNMIADKTGLTIDDVLKNCLYLIVTKGEEGLKIYEPGNETAISAYQDASALNPTGAGDALRAGLLVGLVEGKSLTESAQIGSALASMVVEIEGTQLEEIDEAELERRLEWIGIRNSDKKV